MFSKFFKVQISDFVLLQNEYRCHSCYAFASTAAVESAYAIKTDKLLSLSAQQIVDCSRKSNKVIAY